MPKNFAHFRNLVEHAIGDQTDPRIPTDQVVNEAGRYLCSMHEWTWLRRPPAGVNFVASQNYVTLPTDFEQLVSVSAANTIESRVFLTDLNEVQALRNSTITDTLVYWVALEYPTQASTTVSPANARLAIYPTPSANSTNALYVTYRAGWVELAANLSVPNIPLDCEPLLAELCRAFARGYESRKLGGLSVSGEINAIEGSAMLARIKRKYGMDQWNLGPALGGILEGPRAVVYRPHGTITDAG